MTELRKLALGVSAVLMTTLSALSQGTITLTTDAPIGTAIKILPNVKSSTTPVTIDYGNGVTVNYTVDPSMAAYNRWISGTIEGTTITITGYLTELTINEAELTSASIDGMSSLSELNLSKNKLTSFELLSETPLKTLNLSSNTIVNNTVDNPTLTLEHASKTLESLSLSKNPGLVCLNISDLTSLQYLSLDDCPDFGSIFICLPEESRPALRQININNCALAHFYPVNLPSLTTLGLANNDLMTVADTAPFELGNYPALTSLNVSGNTFITTLDVTGCTKLETLSASDTQLTDIDVSQAPDLRALFVANTKISSLDLGNNTSLKSLNVSGTKISNIDFEKLTSLTDVNISDTNISRAVVMYAYYLQKFEARNTKLEFVDFNGQQPNRMTLIDLRDNSLMTSETVDYTLHTLPIAKSSYGSTPNLLLSGSNADHADTEYATSMDMGWICDVTGDATAQHQLVSVTLQDATDTGENKTGSLDRLYPMMGMGLDYDLDIYSTTGGKFLVAQWKPVYYQSIMSVTNEARIGVPIYIYVYPDEGKRFKSVTVNGQEIFSQWFVISESSTIKVNFTAEESSIVLTTTPGQSMSMLVNTTNNNGTVWVDWGTGTRTEYTGQNKYTSGYAELSGTRIDGTAAAANVTIYGDVAGLDVSGFGDAAEYFGLWDNAITAIDLSNASDIKLLNVYWNPISTIDLSTLPNLEVLNTSYTNLKQLDLSHNPGIMWLEAYSDGFGDEDEGISRLTTLDVTNQEQLLFLDAKGNDLSSIDLSANKELYRLNLNNNSIAAIDLSQCTKLEYVSLADNELTSVDFSNNPAMIELTVDGNNLTELNVSANTMLEELSLANNNIHSIDLSANTALGKLYINGNGMTADELNDIYYLLPLRNSAYDATHETTQTGWNLAVIQGGDRSENEGTRADSSIAKDREWTPSHEGTNGGSDTAYLDVLYDSTYGTVTITDDSGNEYGHGSKAPKYATMHINAAPAAGYKMQSFTLNDDEAQTGDTFTMPGIYTKLRITFAETGGIDDSAAAAIKIGASHRQIIVTAPGKAKAEVYSLTGAAVASSNFDGADAISVAAGTYLVKVATADASQADVVIVK